MTPEQAVKLVSEFDGNITRAARSLGKSRQWLSYYLYQNPNFKPVTITPEEHAGYALVVNDNIRKTNNKLRKDNKALSELILSQSEYLDELKKVVSGLSRNIKYKPAKTNHKGKPIIIEALFSDLQIGKLCGDSYNTNIAVARVKEYGRVLCEAIQQKQQLGYNIQEVKLVLLGDIIESDEKHGLQSARGCDISTAEQMALATKIIYKYVIEPVSILAYINVICIAGNHDWNDHGMSMHKAGRTMLSYTIYSGLQLISEEAGINATFQIPKGTFFIDDIFGSKVLYEHGVNVQTTEQSMKAHKNKRAEQLKSYIQYFRMGDKHNVIGFNNWQHAVNGSFFGSGSDGEEYSSVAGFSSIPAQLVLFHVARNDDRTTMFDSLVIQLGHIKDVKNTTKPYATSGIG